MAKETEIDVTGGQQEQVDALAAKVDKLTKALKKNRKETNGPLGKRQGDELAGD